MLQIGKLKPSLKKQLESELFTLIFRNVHLKNQLQEIISINLNKTSN